jgi:osmotically-inducible protein OsmY
MNRSKKDHDLQHAVLGELAWETRVRETDIGVTVCDSVVTLTGTVDCWAEKQAAQEAAHRVRGVLDVANDIQIKPSWDPEKSDTEIAKAARVALDWNVNVPQSIQTDVWNGVVKLSGVVETLQQRSDAEDAIRVIRGVRGLENSIVVEPPNVGADALRAAIEGALSRHVAREAKRISIEVDGDYVRLTGEVDSKVEHDAALGAVIGTRGVRAVEDRLRIAI